MIIDATNYIDNFKTCIKIENSDFNKSIDSVKEINDKIQKTLSENNMNPRSVADLPNTAVLVLGIEKFISKLDDEHLKAFKEILNNNKETAKINFIFVDIPSAFKKYE